MVLGRCTGKLGGGLQLCLTQLRPLAGRLPGSRVSLKAEVEDLGEASAPCYVRLWHIADVPLALTNVCFEG